MSAIVFGLAYALLVGGCVGATAAFTLLTYRRERGTEP